MDCPICANGKMKKVKAPYQANYGGQPVSLSSAEMFRCSNCGERVFDPDQAEALSVAVKNSVRQMFGLLSPDEILAIRQKLGMTQVELEDIFGQGPKVVTRWESGRVIQNKNADTILRMLNRKPDLLPLVKSIAKDRSKAQRKNSKTEEPRELAAANS